MATANGLQEEIRSHGHLSHRFDVSPLFLAYDMDFYNLLIEATERLLPALLAYTIVFSNRLVKILLGLSVQLPD
jgi:hypothetical protein